VISDSGRRKLIGNSGQTSLLLIILLSVCVVAIVVFFFFALRQRVPNVILTEPIRPNPPEVRPEPLEPAEIFNNFETIPLTEKYNWIRTSTADDTLDYYISYDDRYKKYVETERVEVRNLDFNGSLYKTLLTGLDEVSLEEAYNVFTESYLNGLLSLGWKYSLNYKDYYIAGLSADGVTGKLRGVVKKEGDEISTVIVVADYKGLVSELPEGVSVKCPCEVTLKVFVGDPVNIELITAAGFAE